MKGSDITHTHTHARTHDEQQASRKHLSHIKHVITRFDYNLSFHRSTCRWVSHVMQHQTSQEQLSTVLKTFISLKGFLPGSCYCGVLSNGSERKETENGDVTYLDFSVEAEQSEKSVHVDESLPGLSVNCAQEVEGEGELKKQAVHHHQVSHRHRTCVSTAQQTHNRLMKHHL